MENFLNLINASVKLYDGAPRNMGPTFGVGCFGITRDTGYVRVRMCRGASP